ncbi:hypothetical protein [Streptomyces sp. NK15101]|uniref:hypothetical protein n=1 Tax=Streptomyces sp. NK15101 TaxID=2873261 RepID=UPI001CEDEE6A|nr:hypothetical protein [Streptomyces sp. NK15101]
MPPAAPRTAAPVPVGPPQDVPEAGLATGDREQRRQRVEALPDNEGFLGRLRRRAREAHEFGVVTMLLLLLIPAAVAAALLGSRVK